MRNTSLEKLELIALVVGLALPSMADSLPSNGFSPDRDSRYHRDSTDLSDSVTSNNAGYTGDSQFRPGRGSSFNVVLNVSPPANDESGPLADNPLDAPADQVPEPSTLLLLGPAVIGVLRKLQR